MLVRSCTAWVRAAVVGRDSISQPAAARTPPPDRRNFVACPIVRDTSTLPCWLAEYEGELYYLGSQGSSASAFYPPQLGHEALIEGTVADGPRVCGGRVLAPVHVSVMQELTPRLQHRAPGRGRIDAGTVADCARTPVSGQHA